MTGEGVNDMKTRKLFGLAFMPVILMSLASCATTMSGEEDVAVMETKTGAIVVDTFTTDATVVALDGTKRKVTLETPDGKKTKFKAGPEVANFDQLQIGDQVHATVTEELALSLRPSDAPPSAGEAMTVALTPVGAKPGQGRRGEAASDREIGLLVRLPRFALRAVTWLQPRLDRLGLLPARLVEDDPLYASAFVANLGSVGLDAAYHHLFEYGTVPIFVTMGRVHRAPLVHDDGRVGSHEVFVLRYTYDERIEDGFYAARALEALAGYLADPAALSGASSG